MFSVSALHFLTFLSDTASNGLLKVSALLFEYFDSELGAKLFRWIETQLDCLLL